MAVLGLRFCARAFSSCGKWGPLFIAVRRPLTYRGLSCCGAQAPDAQAQQLWLTGLVAPWHVGSSQTRAQTPVPCTAGRFSTTAPPGKTQERSVFFFLLFLYKCILCFNSHHEAIFEIRHHIRTSRK